MNENANPQNTSLQPQKKSKKKGLIIGIAIVAAIIILFSIIGGKDSNTGKPDTSQNTQSPQQTESETKEENSKIAPGGVVEGKMVKITYVSCDSDYKGYDQFSKPKDGYKIMRIEMEFENTSSSDTLISSLDCYADGYKCDTDYFQKDADFISSISAGRKAKGIYYYLVPENAETIEFEFDDSSLWSNKKIIFVP